MKSIDEIPWFALKIMRILVMTPLMVKSPFSAKPVLVLSFDFGLADLELSLVEIGESNFPTLCLKCVLLIRQGRDQVHGPCWWENTNRTKIVFIVL